MRPQSLAFPYLLFFGGVVAATYLALDGEWLWFSGACLVAMAGLHELRTTRTFNEDMKRFERE